jgi:hypothetical protein
MKKVALIFSFLFITVTLAQSQTIDKIEKTDYVEVKTKIQSKKVQWSAAWGLFGNAPKEKQTHIAFEFDTSGFKEAIEPLESKIDTSRYEIKSYLWGAVKWTQKK